MSTKLTPTQIAERVLIVLKSVEDLSIEEQKEILRRSCEMLSKENL